MAANMVQASYQPVSFIDYDEVNAIENIAHGLCLMSAFFQGLSGNDRMVESLQRQKISKAIAFMVEHIDSYDDKQVTHID
jgi:hypothetical protein